MPANIATPIMDASQMTSIDLACSGVPGPRIFHCEDESQFFRRGFMGESLQLPERIATNGLRDAADRGPALPVPVGEALQALPRLEATAAA
jgi:hypothetical protein